LEPLISQTGFCKSLWKKDFLMCENNPRTRSAQHFSKNGSVEGVAVFSGA